jgi:hypothetical protein
MMRYRRVPWIRPPAYDPYETGRIDRGSQKNTGLGIFFATPPISDTKGPSSVAEEQSMRSLNLDRLMVSAGSDTIDAGMVLPSVNLGRLSTQRDDRLTGGLFRVAGGVTRSVVSSAIPAIVTMSDGTQITFDSVAAHTR